MCSTAMYRVPFFSRTILNREIRDFMAVVSETLLPDVELRSFSARGEKSSATPGKKRVSDVRSEARATDPCWQAHA
jgi:hypothetical protein